MVLTDIIKTICNGIPEIEIEKVHVTSAYLHLRVDSHVITDTRDNGFFRNYPIAFVTILQHGDPRNPLKTISFNLEAGYRKIGYMREDLKKYPGEAKKIRARISQYEAVRDRFLSFLETLSGYETTRKNKEKEVIEITEVR
jgi:hypothetical protein